MLESLLNPASIAVIGASQDPTKIGNAVMDNLVKQGFHGKIYPVNPSCSEILGKTCYPDIDSINDQIDLAVVALPSKIAVKVLQQCVQKKVKYVIIVAGGFSESGEDGRNLEEMLLKEIRGTETRVIGPNTVGVLFPHSKVNTALTPSDRIWFPGEGNIAFISQSGALGLLVMDSITENGTGISGFVNIGNRVDVNEVDLMEMFLGDVSTRSIVLYLESISDGNRFYETLRKTVKRKPVVVLKAGRSTEASMAASFHTGALATDDRVMDGILRQAGAIRAYNEVELLDFGKVLAYSRPLNGKRIAVVTTAGGVGVVTTDLLTSEDRFPAMSMARFSDGETSELRKYVLPIASVANPIDLTADGSNESYERILSILSESSQVDGIIVYALPQTPKIDDSIVEYIKRAAEKKATVVGVVGNRLAKGMLKELETAKVPAYPSIQRTVSAMKALYQYSVYMGRVGNE